MGWLFDSKVYVHLNDMSNAGDLRKDANPIIRSQPI